MTSRSPRRIAVITGTRAEYGLLRWVILDLRPAAVEVIATAAHLADEYGRTVNDIRADGITPVEITSLVEPTPLGVSRSIARVVEGLAAHLTGDPPDLVLLLGDRFETLAAALAASALRIPIAHIHGGEITTGAQDDAWRHAITKLAHLHFAATALSGERIAQLGEERWRIHVVGALGLEQLRRWRVDPAVERRLRDLGLRKPVAVVTYHPTTLGGDPTRETTELTAALEKWTGTIVVTAPNADIGSAAVRAELERFVAVEPQRRRFVASLGNEAYLGLLKVSDVMIGNSSSGIIEAPSVPLAVVNVGARQEGRERAANVIDVPAERVAIADGIRRAMDPVFTASLKGIANPYGDGRASERIAQALREIEPGERLLRKRFLDLSS